MGTPSKQQSALAELSQLALESNDLKLLCESALSLIAETMQLRYCEVLEYEPAAQRFLLRAGLGWKTDFVGQATIPLTREFQAAYTFLTLRRVVVDDYEEETPFVKSPLLLQHDIRSGITVHIPGIQAPYGVLGVYSSMRRSYSSEEVSFLRSAANILGTAMQRKHDEETIRRSELYFRGILESAPDGMAIVDREGRILQVNRETERLFGYQREELIGQPIEILVPERFRPHHGGHRNGYFHDPRLRPMGVGLDLYGRRKDSSEFPVEISLSPMQTPEGMVITAAVRDVSARKAAEEQIKKLNAQLEEALRRSERLAATGRAAASLAHEINNPLTVLTDLLYVLSSQTELADASREILQSARKEVERLCSIAHGTLAPHRSSTEKVRIRASELLETSVAGFQRRLDQGRVLVAKHFHSEASIEVVPSELRQVLTNLIANALDAMNGAGTLTLETTDDGANVRLTIADTGTGIQMDKLEEVFEPFVTTKGEQGLGIGLWISRNIVEKMGGQIGVRSSTAESDHGTQFTVTLPSFGSEVRGNGKIRLVS